MKTEMVYKQKKKKQLFIKDDQTSAITYQQDKKKIFYKNEGIKILNDDIITTNEIPENSIDLIITSPPYNVDIEYSLHNDKESYKDYLQFTQKW